MGRFRSVSLLLAGAYAVHTLRYALAYGDGARLELLRQGHGYLLAAPYVLTFALALATSQLLLRAAAGAGAPAPGAPAGERASLARLWAVLAASLLLIFCVQESVERVLTAGHPAGPQALVGGGGWLAAPLAIVVGLVLALLQRGARRLLAAVGQCLRAPRPRPLAATLASCTPRPAGRALLGSWLRGRAPPAFAG